MTDYLFYKQHTDQTISCPCEDPSLQVSFWKPRWCRVRPRGIPGCAVLGYWALHYLRIFRNCDYTFLSIFKDGVLVHHAAGYPSYFRFPFMANNDMQIGYVWTNPMYRGRGLGTLGVKLLVNELRTPNRALWYVVNRDNKSSICLAEKADFQYVGKGSKQAKWKISLLSRYNIIESCNADSFPKAA